MHKNACCFILHKARNRPSKIGPRFIDSQTLLTNHLSAGDESYGNMHWAETDLITINLAKQSTSVFSYQLLWIKKMSYVSRPSVFTNRSWVASCKINSQPVNEPRFSSTMHFQLSIAQLRWQKWFCDEMLFCVSLLWRQNERDGVSIHQPYDCLINRLFCTRSRKHHSSASLAFVRGIHQSVTRKMFPFDDVIMGG